VLSSLTLNYTLKTFLAETAVQLKIANARYRTRQTDLAIQKSVKCEKVKRQNTYWKYNFWWHLQIAVQSVVRMDLERRVPDTGSSTSSAVQHAFLDFLFECISEFKLELAENIVAGN